MGQSSAKYRTRTTGRLHSREAIHMQPIQFSR